MAYSGSKRNTHIPALKNRITLCSMQDIVDDGGTMQLTRTAALKTVWADVQPTKPNFFSTKPSFLSVEGRGIIDDANKPTHTIYMRPNHTLNLTTAAWVYEERRVSSPRWYKIIGMLEEETGTEITCRLVERSDTLTKPVALDKSVTTPGVTSLEPLPEGVVL
jgi:hypothetical protein